VSANHLVADRGSALAVRMAHRNMPRAIGVSPQPAALLPWGGESPALSLWDGCHRCHRACQRRPEVYHGSARLLQRGGLSWPHPCRLTGQGSLAEGAVGQGWSCPLSCV